MTFIVVCGLAPLATANVNLNLRFRDSGGTALGVRVGVFSGAVPLIPANPEGVIYQDRGAASYFYSSGNTSMSVPEGDITIRAGRGFEFAVLDTTITVTSNRTITFRLPQLFNMKALGWYSGDTHVHISHPPVNYTLDATDLALIARGEELNFINSMEEEPFFTGVIDPVSTADRIIYFGKEQRNAHFSHLTMLGLTQWMVDAGCTEQGIACGRTLNGELYAQAHDQPGEVAVIATHPFSTFDAADIDGWPGVGMWRGMPIDLAAGTVDAIDLLCFTNVKPPAAIEPYFEALNAGFRVPSSVGTDCLLASGESLPAGGYRVFVKPQGTFTMDSWIAGLKAGRSFVSNYPLITSFEVEGAVSGDVLPHDGPELAGTISVVCRLPITRVEIWGDPGLLQSLTPPNGSAKSFTSSFNVPSPGVTWLVARVTGPAPGWHVVSANGLFAQTSPVYVDAGTPTNGLTRAAAADYFLDRLDETVSVFDTLGYFPGNSRATFDMAVASARAYYQTLMVPPTAVESPALKSSWALRNVWPNPFGGEAHIEYISPENGEPHTIAVYDAAGRTVRTLFAGRRAGGEHRLEWDGRDEDGRRVASGVYFVRVHTANASVGRKMVLLR
ncbi:MAG TPA: CehA/McbA family metallohydrolase [Candidatus Krumholzibacteria bacterium]|nr:CehA/McbA family metallohydrolase [Candidatus Krumholzibacteria bacterium]